MRQGVAPLVGAWIEIRSDALRFWSSHASRPSWARGLKSTAPIIFFIPASSRPSWARGLKFIDKNTMGPTGAVAPLVGAWIEIRYEARKRRGRLVAPLVGAWIEIGETAPETRQEDVAPLVGAWIEIG